MRIWTIRPWDWVTCNGPATVLPMDRELARELEVNHEREVARKFDSQDFGSTTRTNDFLPDQDLEVWNPRKAEKLWKSNFDGRASQTEQVLLNDAPDCLHLR